MPPRHRKPVRFNRPRTGYITRDTGGPVRLSTALRLLREQGSGDFADTLTKMAQEVAPWCPGCGRTLDDPAIGLAGDQVAFVCPWCSGPELLRAWEAEGAAAATSSAPQA